jgi:ABC-type transport system substrate-binding protein
MIFTPGWRRFLASVLSVIALVATASGPGALALSAHRAAAAMPRHQASAAQARCPKRNVATGSITIGFTPYGILDLFGAANFPLWENLFEQDPTGHLIPQMGTAAPILKNGGILNGGKTIVVHLKQGLRWSNGAEITSADVRFGWQVSADSAAGGCAWCDLINRIDTPDRYTAVLHLKGPGTTMLFWLREGAVQPQPTTWPLAWSHDPHQAAVKLNQDPSWNWIGPLYPTSGPYYIASATTTEMVLRPMPYYATMSCGAYLARIIVRSYPSNSALLAAAASHRVDLMPYLIQGLEFLPRLEDHRDAYVTHLEPSTTVENIPFNGDPTYEGKPNPLHDARVRLALALALDKISVTKEALPVTDREASRLLVWSPWINTPKLVEAYADRSITGQWDPIAKRYDPNPGRGVALLDAKKLLGETPWKHGFSLDFDTTANIPTRQAEEALIAAQWARLGVKVVAHFVDATKLFDGYANGGILQRGNYQTALFGEAWGYGGPEIMTHLLASKSIPSDGGDYAWNYARIRDRLIDRNLERALNTLDHKVQARSYAAVQREVNQQAYWIMLWSRPAVWTDDRRVQGLRGGASDVSALRLNSWTWKLNGH